MNINPKISLIIPVYNGSSFVGDAINSALAQTYSNIEILVINDGSNDNGLTEKIVQAYGNKVRYFAKPNGGVASALNFAVKNMSGDYFSWLSHDDLYYPNKIEKQVQILNIIKNKNAILYSDYEVFYEDPSLSSPVRMKGVPPQNFRYWITIENCLHGCTLLIPKSAFEVSGLFDEHLKTTQDYDLWFRMAENFEFIHMPDVLVKARSHPDQGSLQLQGIALKECNELLSKFVKNLKRSELIVATNKMPDVIYAEISSNMSSRGFHEAGKVAKELETDFQELGYEFTPVDQSESTLLKAEQETLINKYVQFTRLMIVKFLRFIINIYRKTKSYTASN